MKYISTRGQTAPKTFSEVLLMGLAPDGGLMMPEEYPAVSETMLERWRGLSYADLAFEVIRLFATDIPENDLRAIINKSYTAEAFGSDDITPVRSLKDGIKIQALSNGPTLAFKDMAMQFLGNAFEYVLERENRSLNILGATSGDTGSAAEYAMRGKRGIHVFMLSPEGRMSPFQRAQMYSLQDDNIVNIAVRGMFDDCQDIIKAVQSDARFKEQYQIRPRTTEHTYVTSSPSMDISKASNFERFIFDLTGRDTDQIQALWAEVASGKGFDLHFKLDEIRKEYGFVSAKSTHADRLATIRAVYQDGDGLIDPHTADGVKAARELREPGETVVCLETALPAKFEDTIREALGSSVAVPRPAKLEGLESLPQKVLTVPNNAEAVKTVIREKLA